MEDFSTKPIKEIQTGDAILDGHLNPVTVMAVNTSFLGRHQLTPMHTAKLKMFHVLAPC